MLQILHWVAPLLTIVHGTAISAVILLKHVTFRVVMSVSPERCVLGLQSRLSEVTSTYQPVAVHSVSHNSHGAIRGAGGMEQQS